MEETVISIVINLFLILDLNNFFVYFFIFQEEEDPLPPHPLILENGSIETHHPNSQRATSPGQYGGTLSPPTLDFGRPTSPGMPKKLGSSNESKGFKGFSRRLSKRGN